MELEKARLKHQKKKLGKCFDCLYRESDRYCLVRESNMYYDIIGDLFKIKFCKYYEKRK